MMSIFTGKFRVTGAAKFHCQWNRAVTRQSDEVKLDSVNLARFKSRRRGVILTSPSLPGAPWPRIAPQAAYPHPYHKPEPLRGPRLAVASLRLTPPRLGALDRGSESCPTEADRGSKSPGRPRPGFQPKFQVQF
jgi:hypothetical protein